MKFMQRIFGFDPRESSKFKLAFGTVTGDFKARYYKTDEQIVGMTDEDLALYVISRGMNRIHIKKGSVEDNALLEWGLNGFRELNRRGFKTPGDALDTSNGEKSSD